MSDPTASPVSGPDQHVPRISPAPRRVGIYEALWATGWVLIAAIAAFQVYDVFRRRDIVIETAEHRFASLARALAEQTARSIQLADAVVRETVTDQQLGGLRHREQSSDGQTNPGREVNQRMRNRILAIAPVRNLLVAGADGKVVASTDEARAQPVSLAGQTFFIALRNSTSSGLQLSEPFRGPGDGSWTMALSRRIDGPAGQFRGAAVAYLNLDYFRRSYAAVDLGPGCSVSLFLRDGSLLARYPDGGAGIHQSFPGEPRFRDLLAETDGATRITHGSADGLEAIHATQVVAGLPLVLSVGVDRAVLLAPWNIQASHSALRTTLMCVSLMVLLWLVLRQLRRREQAEARLRVQTALLDELFESAPEAIVMLDLEQRVTRVNREFTRMFGHTAEESQGRPLDDLIVPEDLRSEARRLAQAVRHGHHTGTETERLCADGRRLHVSVLGAPILTPSGQIASYAIYRDITEQKLAEAERSKLESRLRQAVKLEAIGTMAGGIAHDFNNILGAILGYGDMALNAAGDGSALKRYLGNVMAAAHRAKALVDQILTYSRSTRGKRGVVSVCAVGEETLELVRASLPVDIELRSRLEATKATVIGDPTQIHQLVMNLCTNAIHSMHSGGTLSVIVDAVDTSADRELSHGLLPAGCYVRLAVQDTGCGMEPEVTERIFEPFFTTREVGSGTGLGLALVQSIVTELGGAIDVTSKPGAGSAFALFLPRSDVPAMERAAAEHPLPRGRGDRVLLVEDEKALMLLAEEMLAALGYEPAGFTRSSEALTEFRVDPERFDAVVIDHLMPGMTGIELARHLREARPDIPIVLVSGYTGPLLAQEAQSAGVDQILTKPLDFRQLADAMAKVLPRAYADSGEGEAYTGAIQIRPSAEQGARSLQPSFGNAARSRVSPTPRSRS